MRTNLPLPFPFPIPLLLHGRLLLLFPAPPSTSFFRSPVAAGTPASPKKKAAEKPTVVIKPVADAADAKSKEVTKSPQPEDEAVKGDGKGDVKAAEPVVKEAVESVDFVLVDKSVSADAAVANDAATPADASAAAAENKE